MNPDDYIKCPHLLKFLSETGMTIDEASIYLEKKFKSDKKQPSEEEIIQTKKYYDDCKRRGLLD
jgi:hypothetical protein